MPDLRSQQQRAEWTAWQAVCAALREAGAVTGEDLEASVRRQETMGQRLFNTIKHWGALYAQLAATPGTEHAEAAADESLLYIIFDGPPGPEAGRFVEVETAGGRSVNAGEWEVYPGAPPTLWRLGPFRTAGASAERSPGDVLMLQTENEWARALLTPIAEPWKREGHHEFRRQPSTGRKVSAAYFNGEWFVFAPDGLYPVATGTAVNQIEAMRIADEHSRACGWFLRDE